MTDFVGQWKPDSTKWILKGGPVPGHDVRMTQHWTSRMSHSARRWGRVFRTAPRAGSAGHLDDADARRARADLDAIRARFPDHA